MLRILVVEDEAHNRGALAEMLTRMGHDPAIAEDGQEGLDRALSRDWDLILSDVRMPRMDGLQFFDALRRLWPAPEATFPPFVFMTAYGRVEDAVDAMRRGALNFLSKPLRKKDIAAAVAEAEAVLVKRRGSAKPAIRPGDGRTVFASRAFGEVVNMTDRVAASLASVLLVGESGTGKEVIARRLHERSGRASGPFVAFHPGAVPETLMEAELFGHERGAFTGAEVPRPGLVRCAHRGTFFIDEVATMPPAVQTKLLRLIQERTVTPLGGTVPVECDVRWVAATNVELEKLVAEGKFREDLLYRLSVVVIGLPPLRERPEDIDALVDHFRAELAARDSREPLSVPEPTRELLRAYPWPGNVRELRNVIERAVALAPDSVFTPDLLPPHMASAAISRDIRIAVGSSLQAAEDRLIEETLRSCGGDKAQAAAILGVAPRTIYRWLERRDGDRNRP